MSANARNVLSIVLAIALAGCGDGSDGGAAGPGTSAADEILAQALGRIGTFTPVSLDTAAIARAAASGDPVTLPFAPPEGPLVEREVRLALRNLRAPDLENAVVKDGLHDQARLLPLPPPATYQGVVKATDGGKPGAIFATITSEVVIADLLVAPDGWTLIEPIEPMLRLRGVDAEDIRRVLRQYDHIVFNSEALTKGRPGNLASDVEPHRSNGFSRGRAERAGLHGGRSSPGRVAAAEELVMSIVADGDAALFAAYPPTSVVPFWLEQEALLNALDWLYNCGEADAGGLNSFTECGNSFDGGGGAFQARVRIDRFEAWEAGGPGASGRSALLEESSRFTHQADPPCCGEPHTAGQSSAVVFLTGKSPVPAGGIATVGGLGVYGPGCNATGDAHCCHHAILQVVPDAEFPATLLHRQMLFVHEISHLTGAGDDVQGHAEPWLYDSSYRSPVMYSMGLFGWNSGFRFGRKDRAAIAPLITERLGSGSGTAEICTGKPVL